MNAKTIVIIVSHFLCFCAPVYCEDYISPVVYSGWNMFSVPLQPENSDPATGLGIESPMIYGYASESYRNASDDIALVPGKGYALKLREGGGLKLNVPGTLVSTSTNFEVILDNGWNLIGNPFNNEVLWYAATVDGESVIKSTKIENELIEYNPYNQQYETTSILKPWKGFWVWANDSCNNCVLTINPISSGGVEGYVYTPVGGKALSRAQSNPPSGLEPLIDANVNVTCGDIKGEVLTDYSGYFEIYEFPPVECDITITKTGYLDYAGKILISENSVTQAGGSAGNILLRLQTGNLKVVSNIQGGSIYVDGQNASATISDELSFIFTDIPVGDHSVAIAQAGYDIAGPSTATVVLGETTMVSFTMNSSSNNAPVADAGNNGKTFVATKYNLVNDDTGGYEYIPYPNQYDLDGSNSSDSDGDPLTFSWEQISGPAVELSSYSASKTTFVPLEEATYTFRLTVSDGITVSAPDTVSVFAAKLYGKIAFHAVSASSGWSSYDVYTINADGSDIQQVTFSDKDARDPNWSPDGTEIVYGCSSEGINTICKINADGTGMVASTIQNIGLPAYSPDGREIVFSCLLDNYYEICKMKSDLTSFMQLTNLKIPQGLHISFFSPDASKIIFYGWMSYDNWDIYVMDSDGSNPINLSNDEATQVPQGFTPDGKILYTKGSCIGCAMAPYVMNLDGSDKQLLGNYSTNINFGFISLSTDGKFLFYVDSNHKLGVVDSDTKELMDYGIIIHKLAYHPENNK